MSYVPEFENDVFISYAHIDNQALVDGQRGWIQHLHRSLEIRLQQLLGDELTIWRDEKLQGNDSFSDALLKKFPKCAVLVSVLSPRYLKSDWCLKELREFYRATEQSGGVRLEDKSRVFKVVKTHVPREEHPPELRDTLGYEFFHIDPMTGRPREFPLDPRDETYQRYWAKLEDLAYDLHELLKAIRGRGLGGPGTVPAAGAPIYLAETTSDLTAARDSLARELRQRGHTIVPARPLPLTVQELNAAVPSELDRVQLSIHLIGAAYGIVPEGDSRSVVRLQHELAAAAAAQRGFPRIVWLPPGLETEEQRQRDFVDELQGGAGSHAGVELLQTSLEDLKTFIHDTLARRPAAPPPTDAPGPLHIYLICDQRDADAVRPLEDYLFEHGFEVVRPVLEGDEVQVREDHKENLLRCDGALIYYGAANELWLRAKLRDLDKAYGYGRSKPMLAKAVYVSGPVTAEKERFRTHAALVIHGPQDFAPAVLAPFLAPLETARGARS